MNWARTTVGAVGLSVALVAALLISATTGSAEDGIVGTIQVGEGPIGITTGADGSLWVAEDVSGEASRVDPLSRTVTANVPLNGSGLGAGTGADGSIWITYGSTGPGTAGRIDPATNTITTELQVGLVPGSPTADADGIVWVPNQGDVTPGSASVSRIDPAADGGKGAVTDTIAMPLGVLDVAASGPAVWVTISQSNELQRIDRATKTATSVPIRMSFSSRTPRPSSRM